MDDYLQSTIRSYDKTVREYAKNVAPLHPYHISDRFIKLLLEESFVLDVGCGSGRDAEIFVSHGFSVTGIDLSENMIEYARKNVKGAAFQVMDLRNLTFDKNSFHGIWASASYLHVRKHEIGSALQEAHRVLKPGGIFYLSVKEGAGEQHEPDTRYGNCEKFWSYFSEKEIKTILEDSGFNVVHSEHEMQESEYATHPFIHILCGK